MTKSMHGYDDSYYQGNQQDRDRPALALYQRLVRRYLPSGPIVDFGLSRVWCG